MSRWSTVVRRPGQAGVPCAVVACGRRRLGSRLCIGGARPTLMKQCIPPALTASVASMSTNRWKMTIGACRFQDIRPCRRCRLRVADWTMKSKCLITEAERGFIGLRDGRCLPYVMRLRTPGGSKGGGEARGRARLRRICLDGAAPSRSGHWPVIAPIDFIRLPARMRRSRSING